jgi:hypothetical protein
MGEAIVNPQFKWEIPKPVADRVAALILEEIEGCQMDPLDDLTKGLRAFIYEIKERANTKSVKAAYVPPKKLYVKKKRWERGPLSGEREIAPWKGDDHFEEPKPKHIADGLLAVLELTDPREDS